MRICRALISIATLLLTVNCHAQVMTMAPNGKMRTTSLSAVQKVTLLPALQEATGQHAPDLLQSFNAFPEPLTPRGPEAIFAISVGLGCGVHNDCMFLVFRQEDGKDLLILNSVAGDFDLLSRRHNGYRDLQLKNYQGVHTMVSNWAYDGQRYHAETCNDESSDGARKPIPPSECAF